MILCRPGLYYAMNLTSISDLDRFICPAITIKDNDYTMVNIYGHKVLLGDGNFGSGQRSC